MKLVVALLMAAATAFAEEKSFKLEGTFVEGCSCKGVCMGAIDGKDPGCEALAVVDLTGGSYQGVDLSGVKVVVVWPKDKRTRVFIEAPNPRQHEAAAAFGKAYAGEFGKVDAVKDAHIELTGKDGKFTAKVDGGKIMEVTTEPALGGDKKTPVVYENVYDPFNTKFYHARIVSATYHDGDSAFTLKDSNSFFNPRLNANYKPGTQP
jgi:hypothetical protein